MSTSPIGSTTTPPVTNTTATTPTNETDRQAEPAAIVTSAAASSVDAFEKTEKAPVTLTPPVEDDWGDCEFDSISSGGGGAKALDPTGRIQG